jgi:23S rRNA pseudouridine955/2504/2580 synthase/23S rRNA pseudouridine1911/1915/1917 synthase
MITKFKLSKHDEEERPMISRVALHSFKLVFKDENEQPIIIEAEIPKEFRALMQQLKKIG